MSSAFCPDYFASQLANTFLVSYYSLVFISFLSNFPGLLFGKQLQISMFDNL